MLSTRIVSSKPICAQRGSRRSPIVAFKEPQQISRRNLRRMPGFPFPGMIGPVPVPLSPFGGIHPSFPNRNRMVEMLKLLDRELQSAAPEHPLAQGHMPVDIVEHKEKIIFKADVPGLKRQDVKIRVVEDHLLTIEAERKNDLEEKKEEGKYRFERPFGKVSRAFHLPPYANLESIKARVEDGVLTIEVGKTEEKQEAEGFEVQVE